MSITIKLPIQNKIDISNYIKEYNSIVRYSYNRFSEKLSEKDIRHLLKSKNILNTYSDSWITQCAIKTGKSWYEKDKTGKLIFGSKKNFKLRSQNKISNIDFKKSRLHSMIIQGESLQNGNRKFELDIIKNNRIIFKLSRKIKIEIQLPKLRINIKNQLVKLEKLSKLKKLPFQISISNENICITYEESKLSNLENQMKLQPNRIFSIDMNPNYIGWSVLEFDSSNNFKILDKGIIDNIKLNEKLGLSSCDPKQIYQNNKRSHEIYQVSKYLVNKCLYFKCNKFSIEQLNIKNQNHNKGNNYNRLVNNCWNRNSLFSNIKKRCSISNIELVEINPAYSSFIGNAIHGNQYPDQIASSIEIGRRGYRKYESDWFYPNIESLDDLWNRWKKEINQISKPSSWKEAFQVFKTSKLRYRSPLTDFSFKVFSLNSIKSNINLYRFQ